MVSINLFITLFPDVFYPCLRNGFMERIDIVLVDHEAQNVQNMHDDDEFSPFESGRSIELL